MKIYHVYFMSNESKMLYVGVTNNLQYRVAQHKKKLVAGFTSRYNFFKLVYFEEFRDVRDAIAREKEIKGWRRAKKVALIQKRNPAWTDLAMDWYKVKNRMTAGAGHDRSVSNSLSS